MSRPAFLPAHRYALALVCLCLLLVAGGVFWYGRATADATPAKKAGAADDEAQSASAIVLGLARDAMRDGRLVAPEGNNAFEFYFSVLQLDPNNRVAKDSLREAFKLGCAVVEQTVAAGHLDEAQRELQLLRAYDAGNYKYDPSHYETNASNYQLALLGGYLDAQRILLGRQHAAEAVAISARQPGAVAPQ
ncbi:energy transducer TonB [Rhodanobacter denitrificans]|uniref:Energy transducer TonB n=1 Tax=Rhodanobacter denitrificans TaxID=666685 RepID=A0A368KI50_9GAMM|nr:energy transducer TonB [Rhodanobacter denitrificans]RCS31594.1 energy transducer TonB [Rhodanobacter denitrificans]